MSWLRSDIALNIMGGVKDTAVATTLFDPTTVTVGTFEEEWTVRRMLVAPFAQLSYAGGTAAAGDNYEVGFGIYVEARDAAARNPLLIAVSDQEADWLWLGPQSFTAVAPPFVFAPTPLRNVENQLELIDIRTARKVQTDRRIFISVAARSLDMVLGHAPATITLTGRVHVQVLVERTLRR